jgi:hypothetical protein
MIVAPGHRFLAERVGFEPTVAQRPQRFSRPPHSSTLAPLQSSAWIIPKKKIRRQKENIRSAMICRADVFTWYSPLDSGFAASVKSDSIDGQALCRSRAFMHTFFEINILLRLIRNHLRSQSHSLHHHKANRVRAVAN